MTTLYEHGIDLHPLCRGWAIYTGSEGESPDFRGFFLNRLDAENVVRVSSSLDIPLFWEPCIVPAILTEHGIITANDCELDTPEKLSEHIHDIDLSEFSE